MRSPPADREPSSRLVAGYSLLVTGCAPLVQLFAIIAIQRSGRYVIEPKKSARADASLRVAAKRTASTSRPRLSTSAIAKYTAPLTPTSAGTRLAGKSAAE